MKFNSELLKKLTNCFSPSGREENIRELIKKEIEGYVDEITTDALGNLIARKKGTGKKIMFAAHMDQIGLIITHVDERGFLRFGKVGGIAVKELVDHRVIFDNNLEGVVCCEELSSDKEFSIDKLYIDVASTSKEFVEKNFQIGDMCVFKSEYYETEECVVAKALDDRIGCYILIELIKQNIDTDNDIYYTFTVQEEVGLRGARTAGYAINPDIAIAVDITNVGDNLSGSKMDVKLGGGAAIKLMDTSIITHPEVKKLLTEIAKKDNIKYQYEILTAGGTDAGAIHTSRQGVPSGVVSIPTRNLHSESEILSKEDVIESIKLLLGVIKG